MAQSGMDGQNDRYYLRIPSPHSNLGVIWLDTPDSLILAVPNVLGHWRIPKSSLAARFAAQKESGRAAVGAAASQINQLAGTNAVLR